MNKNDYIIRLENKNDYAAVENLVIEAFWNVYRPGCLEHYVLHQMRNAEDFVPELAFVLEKGGEIIGQNVFVKAKIKADDGRDIHIMTMGPICIAPEYKRQGYGKILLDYSLERRQNLVLVPFALKGILISTAKAALLLPVNSASVIMVCRKGRMHPFSFAKN